MTPSVLNDKTSDRLTKYGLVLCDFAALHLHKLWMTCCRSHSAVRVKDVQRPVPPVDWFTALRFQFGENGRYCRKKHNKTQCQRRVYRYCLHEHYLVDIFKYLYFILVVENQLYRNIPQSSATAIYQVCCQYFVSFH